MIALDRLCDGLPQILALFPSGSMSETFRCSVSELALEDL